MLPYIAQDNDNEEPDAKEDIGKAIRNSNDTLKKSRESKEETTFGRKVFDAGKEAAGGGILETLGVDTTDLPGIDSTPSRPRKQQPNRDSRSVSFGGTNINMSVISEPLRSIERSMKALVSIVTGISMVVTRKSTPEEKRPITEAVQKAVEPFVPPVTAAPEKEEKPDDTAAEIARLTKEMIKAGLDPENPRVKASIMAAVGKSAADKFTTSFIPKEPAPPPQPIQPVAPPPVVEQQQPTQTVPIQNAKIQRNEKGQFVKNDPNLMQPRDPKTGKFLPGDLIPKVASVDGESPTSAYRENERKEEKEQEVQITLFSDNAVKQLGEIFKGMASKDEGSQGNSAVPTGPGIIPKVGNIIKNTAKAAGGLIKNGVKAVGSGIAGMAGSEALAGGIAAAAPVAATGAFLWGIAHPTQANVGEDDEVRKRHAEEDERRKAKGLPPIYEYERKKQELAPKKNEPTPQVKDVAALQKRQDEIKKKEATAVPQPVIISSPQNTSVVKQQNSSIVAGGGGKGNRGSLDLNLF